MAAIIVKRLQALKKQITQLAEKVEKLAQEVEEAEKTSKAKPVKSAGKKAASKLSPVRKTASKKKAVTRKTSKETVAKNKAAAPKASSASDQVFAIIEKAQEDGTDTKTLANETGLKGRSLSNVLYRLKKQGKITSPKRGIYKIA